MIDWEGLLKFSLQYSDGTKKSEFKQMTKEDQEFLQGAMNEYCNSEVKRIHKILQLLNEQEKQNQQERESLLEELQELLDSLDKGTVLYNMGGHITMLKIVFYSKFISNRILALQILASANQNDAGVQNQSINCGAMQLVELIEKQADMKIKENMMSTISALVRGQNLEAKRIFIRIGGLELLVKLSQNASPRLLNKMHNLLRDLLFYDDSLHKTFNDLSSFSNTAGLKIEKDNHDLTYDVNAEMEKKNYHPQNAKYRGCVHKFYNEQKQMKQYHEKWAKQNSE